MSSRRPSYPPYEFRLTFDKDDVGSNPHLWAAQAAGLVQVQVQLPAAAVGRLRIRQRGGGDGSPLQKQDLVAAAGCQPPQLTVLHCKPRGTGIKKNRGDIITNLGLGLAR